MVVTAFKGKHNSSAVLIDAVKNEDCIKEFLTNSFAGCEREIRELLLTHKPEMVLSFGLRPDIDQLQIETAAGMNDHLLHTNCDVAFLENSLAKAGISYQISSKPTSYLCNHVYYKGLECIQQHGLDTKMVFIHVPTMKRFQQFDIALRWLEGILYEESNS